MIQIKIGQPIGTNFCTISIFFFTKPIQKKFLEQNQTPKFSTKQYIFVANFCAKNFSNLSEKFQNLSATRYQHFGQTNGTKNIQNVFFKKPSLKNSLTTIQTVLIAHTGSDIFFQNTDQSNNKNCSTYRYQFLCKTRHQKSAPNS